MKNKLTKLLALALAAVLVLALFAGCGGNGDAQQNGTPNSAQNNNGQNVETIRFPEGTESLNCPFQFCEGIREAYIPASVTEIVKDIADHCENLTVIVPAGSYAEEFIQNQKYRDYEYRVE